MTVANQSVSVAEERTGKEICALASDLRKEGLIAEAIVLLENGVLAGACSGNAFELLTGMARTCDSDVLAQIVKVLRRSLPALMESQQSAAIYAVAYSTVLVRCAQMSASDNHVRMSMLNEARDILAEHVPDGLKASTGTTNTEVLLLKCIIALGTQEPPTTVLSAVSDCLRSSKRGHATACVLLASMLSSEGKLSESDAALKSAQGQDGYEPGAGLVHRAQGRLALAQGQVTDAQLAFARAAAFSGRPECAAASWEELGALYADGGLLEDAKACQAQLAKLGGHAVTVQQRQAALDARVLWRSGRHAAALAAVDAALASAWNSPTLLKLKGLICADPEGQCFDSILAQSCLTQALEAIPDDTEASIALGQALQEARYDSAAAAVLFRSYHRLKFPQLIHFAEVDLPYVTFASGRDDA